MGKKCSKWIFIILLIIFLLAVAAFVVFTLLFTLESSPNAAFGERIANRLILIGDNSLYNLESIAALDKTFNGIFDRFGENFEAFYYKMVYQIEYLLPALGENIGRKFGEVVPKFSQIAAVARQTL